MPGEERLPMFGSPYIGRDGVKRRLFTGLVPVSRREAYMGAPRGKPVPPVVDPTTEEKAEETKMGAFLPPVDSRVLMLIDDVIAPWRQIQAQVRTFNDQALNVENKTPDRERGAARWRCACVTRSCSRPGWCCSTLPPTFSRYLPAVSAAIDAGNSAGLTTDAERALYTKLTDVKFKSDTPPGVVTLAEALKRFDPVYRDILERGATLFTEATRSKFDALPRFAFGAGCLAEVLRLVVREPQILRQLQRSRTERRQGRRRSGPEGARSRRRGAATPPTSSVAIPANRSTRFVIRCVLDRPHCGAIHPPILSEPTDPFVMAPFFDPDAPARQVRIALPVDTSPAGLKKFPKGASFLISDVLCGQLGSARKLTLGDLVLSVLPWPFHKDLPEPNVEPCADGMICSLSIPIVTICAFILLIIIAILLNIFFFWVPFLISCFPLPLKAKEQA